MEYLPNILFAIALLAGIGYFARNVKKLIRNIKLGRDVDASDNKAQRWRNMARIALGQSKMVRRPIAGLLHVVVYVGFVIINIEVLEIILDGLTLMTKTKIMMNIFSSKIGMVQVFRYLKTSTDWFKLS